MRPKDKQQEIWEFNCEPRNTPAFSKVSRRNQQSPTAHICIGMVWRCWNFRIWATVDHEKEAGGTTLLLLKVKRRHWIRADQLFSSAIMVPDCAGSSISPAFSPLRSQIDPSRWTSPQNLWVSIHKRDSGMWVGASIQIPAADPGDAAKHNQTLWFADRDVLVHTSLLPCPEWCFFPNSLNPWPAGCPSREWTA